MRFLRPLCSPVILPALLTAVMSSPLIGADPPARIGRVSVLEGAVSFRTGTDDWVAAILNYPITTGDELWSPAGARAEVHVGSSAVRLGPRSLVDFVDVNDRSTRLRLTEGSLYLRVRELRSGDTNEIDTPNGSVSLLGAGHYRLDVSADGQRSTLTVRDGSAEVGTAGGALVSVRSNQTVAFGPGSSASLVTTVPVDQWETWCAARDRRDDASISLRYISPEWVGFADLDDYGTWEVDASFGPVWVPSAELGWAPYRFGSWAWVVPWGWTWIDDAPWGFAPFHYGRWAFRHRRWAWVPGEIAPYPVYAPALAAFVGGSGFDLSLHFGVGGGLAWFPLAPGEVYFPAYRVSRTYIRDVNVTSVKVAQLDFTKIDVTKARYANRSVPGAVTAVSKETFLKGEVAKAAIPVSPRALAEARIIGTTPPVIPSRESVAERASARRPASYGEPRPPTPAGRTGVHAQASSGAKPTRNGPAVADRLRQWQAERDQALARQAAERTELERLQEAELSAPPAGTVPEDLRQRQAQEHEALTQRHREETNAIDRRRP